MSDDQQVQVAWDDDKQSAPQVTWDDEQPTTKASSDQPLPPGTQPWYTTDQIEQLRQQQKTPSALQGSPDEIAARALEQSGITAPVASGGRAPTLTPNRNLPGTMLTEGEEAEAEGNEAAMNRSAAQDTPLKMAGRVATEGLYGSATGEGPEGPGLPYVKGTPQQARGLGEMLGGADRNERYRGATDFIQGTLDDLSPLFTEGFLNQPIKVGGGLAVASLTAKGAREATKLAGGGKDAQDLAETAGFAVPAVTGLGIEARSENGGTGVGFRMFGGKVAGAVATGPESTGVGVKVGENVFQKIWPTGAPSEPQLEAPTIQGEPGSVSGAAPPAPKTPSGQLVEGQNIDEAVQAMAKKDAIDKIAEGIVTGAVPPPPAPGTPEAEPPKGPNMEIHQKSLDMAAQHLSTFPEGQRGPALIEAYNVLAGALMHAGTVVGPDGKLYEATKPEQANKLAMKWINDTVARRAKAEQEAAKQQSENVSKSDEKLTNSTPAVQWNDELVGSKEEPVVPETHATIDKQIDSLKAGNVNVVMIPKGQEAPKAPEGFVRMTVDKGPGAGTYIYNPQEYKASHIRKAAETGTHGAMLGHVQSKEELAGKPTVVVQATAKDGTPIQDSEVEAGNEKAIEAQKAVLQDRHPEATINVKPTDEVVGQRIAEGTKETKEAPEPQRLPQDLRGSKPRYGYKDKNFELQFDNDVDRALYTIAQKVPNKAHDRFMTWLRGQFPGESDAAIFQKGKAIRESIKPMAAEANPDDGPLMVPPYHKKEDEKQTANPKAGGLSSDSEAIRSDQGSNPPKESIQTQGPIAREAEEKVTPEPKERKYKFGSTQANIHGNSEAADAMRLARARISESDLAPQKNDELGGELEPHVTVRYGLQDEATDKVKEYLRQQAPFEATLGKTAAFPPSEHSEGAAPIIAPIESPDLHRINKEIEQHGNFAPSSFPEYKPHATIAYVKADKAARYTGMTVTEGKKFKVTKIAITDRDGNQEVIPLEGGAENESTLPVPMEPNGPQGPAVPSSDTGQVEQLPGGVSGRAQGNNQPQRADEGSRSTDAEAREFLDSYTRADYDGMIPGAQMELREGGHLPTYEQLREAYAEELRKGNPEHQTVQSLAENMGANRGLVGQRYVKRYAHIASITDKAERDVLARTRTKNAGGSEGVYLLNDLIELDDHKEGEANNAIARMLRRGYIERDPDDRDADGGRFYRTAKGTAATKAAGRGGKAAVYPGPLPIPKQEKLAVDERAVERKFANWVNEDLPRAIAAYKELPEAQGGRFIAADVAKQLSPDYQGDPGKYSYAVHNTSSHLAQAVFQEALDEMPKSSKFVFLLGPPGAGKTTAYRQTDLHSRDTDAVVYEGSANSPELIARRVATTGDHGHQPTVVFVYATPEQSAERVATRAMGPEKRVVSSQYLAKALAIQPETVLAIDKALAGKAPVAIYRSVENAAPEKMTPEELDRIRYTGGTDELRRQLDKEFEALVGRGQLDAATFERITGRVYGQPRKGDEGVNAKGPGSEERSGERRPAASDANRSVDETPPEEPQDPITFGMTVPGADVLIDAAEVVKDYLSSRVREEHEKITAAKDMEQGFFDLQKQIEADQLRAVQLMRAAGGRASDWEAIYHNQENPAEPLTAEQTALRDRYVIPVVRQNEEIYSRLNDAEATPNHVHRVVEQSNSWIDRVLHSKSGRAGRGNVLSKSAASLKSRTMMAIQPEGRGNREVVAIKHGRVFAFRDGQAHDLGGLRNGLTTRGKQQDKELGPIARQIDDLNEKIVNLPTQDRAAQLSAIEEKIAGLKNERDLLEDVRGRAPGKEAVHGIEISFGKRARITRDIDQLEKDRERIASATGEAEMTAAGRKSLSAAKQKMEKALDEWERVLNSVPASKLSESIWRSKSGRLWKITQATTKEIEAHTDLRYFHNALASAISENLELRRAERAEQFIEGLKSNSDFSSYAVKNDGRTAAPDGYQPTNLPQLRDYYFEKHVAEVLDRYADELKGGDRSALEKIGHFLTTSIFLNPLLHIPNIAVHWAVEKGGLGLRSMASPLLRSSRTAAVKAVNAVIHQNADYLQALDSGAPLQSHRQDLRDMQKLLFEKLGRELLETPSLLSALTKAWGYKNPANWVRAWYELAGKITWITNDVAFMQSVYEKTGQGWSLKDAITETAKHIPDYRIPTRVADSTMLSKFMRFPLLSQFSAYHYGAMKSYGEAMKSAFGINERPLGPGGSGGAGSPPEPPSVGGNGPGNDEGPAGEPGGPGKNWRDILHGWDILATIGFVTFVLYPLIADRLAKTLSGDDKARVRRAGAATVPFNLYQVLIGEKSPQEALEATLTPSVLAKKGIELAENRDLRTGREVYDQHAPLGTIGWQVGRHLGSAISPVEQAQRAGERSDGLGKWAWSLAGVSFPLTGAEKLASQIRLQSMGTKAQDPDAYEKSIARYESAQAARSGDFSIVNDYQSSGELTPKEAKAIREHAYEDPLVGMVRDFSYGDISRVYDIATPEEQDELRPLLLKKRAALLKRDPEKVYEEEAQ